jgi:hypothetical protein
MITSSNCAHSEAASPADDPRSVFPELAELFMLAGAVENARVIWTSISFCSSPARRALPQGGGGHIQAIQGCLHVGITDQVDDLALRVG